MVVTSEMVVLASSGGFCDGVAMIKG